MHQIVIAWVYCNSLLLVNLTMSWYLLQFLSCHGPLANRQPGSAFLPATYWSFRTVVYFSVKSCFVWIILLLSLKSIVKFFSLDTFSIMNLCEMILLFLCCSLCKFCRVCYWLLITKPSFLLTLVKSNNLKTKIGQISLCLCFITVLL